MTLADRELEAPPTKGQGLPCPIATILNLADDHDRATLQGWLSVPVGDPAKRSDSQMARDLSDEYEARLGRRIGWWTVMKHRNRECRCFVGTPKS